MAEVGEAVQKTAGLGQSCHWRVHILLCLEGPVLLPSFQRKPAGQSSWTFGGPRSLQRRDPGLDTGTSQL